MIVGNVTLSTTIRILVSANIHLNAHYYANHQLFEEKFDSNLFDNRLSVFSICLSEGAMDHNEAGTKCDPVKCVKQEAFLNCSIGTWSSMLCLIASANSLQRTIRSHYPHTYDKRVATVLNAIIAPSVQTDSKVCPVIDLLWVASDGSTRPNHFVPIYVVEGRDYAAQTKERTSKQIGIAKKFETKLGDSRISTKKGKSVNFNNVKSRLIDHWISTPPPPIKTNNTPTNGKPVNTETADSVRISMPRSTVTLCETKSIQGKRKLHSDNNADVVQPGSSKQLKLTDQQHPTSSVEYKRGMPLFKECDVNKYDIGLFLNKTLDSNHLNEILEHRWIPDDNFEYPVTMEGNGEVQRDEKKS